jgi:hypothetical protein
VILYSKRRSEKPSYLYTYINAQSLLRKRKEMHRDMESQACFSNKSKIIRATQHARQKSEPVVPMQPFKANLVQEL